MVYGDDCSASMNAGEHPSTEVTPCDEPDQSRRSHDVGKKGFYQWVKTSYNNTHSVGTVLQQREGAGRCEDILAATPFPIP